MKARDGARRPIRAGCRRSIWFRRFRGQGYAAADVARRRLWVEHKTGVRLEHVGACSVPTEQMRGNIENPIGSVQMPVGIAGPLLIRGHHARGILLCPAGNDRGRTRPLGTNEAW